MAESIKNRVNAMTPEPQTVQELLPLLNAILTDLTALKAALNAHTHGGVTVGAGTSGVANAATMGDLTLAS